MSDRYLKEVVPSKAPRTQKDNIAELDSLLKYFDNPPAPINDIQPVHIREYLDWRGKSAQTRANRERALFSHIFNKAREWGYTSNENPCRGVRGFKETGRDVYVSDEVFWRLFEFADTHIKDIIMVAYLIGQRVADVLKIKITDIQDGALWIEQNKVKTKVRIALTGDLLSLIETLLVERGNVMHSYLLTKAGNGNLVAHSPTICCVVVWTAPAKKQALKKQLFSFVICAPKRLPTLMKCMALKPPETSLAIAIRT